MARVETAKGILKTFWAMTLEDWDEMDHKLVRIAAGVIGFTIMGLVLYFFFRNISPFF